MEGSGWAAAMIRPECKDSPWGIQLRIRPASCRSVRVAVWREVSLKGFRVVRKHCDRVDRPADPHESVRDGRSVEADDPAGCVEHRDLQRPGRAPVLFAGGRFDPGNLIALDLELPSKPVAKGDAVGAEQ